MDDVASPDHEEQWVGEGGAIVGERFFLFLFLFFSDRCT